MSQATLSFLHGIVISKIKPYLRFPLKEYLLESQLMIQKMLCHQKVAENVYVSGEIDSLSIGGVKLSDRAIEAIVLAKGFMYVNVNE
jgi:hypothetical protein